MSATLALQSMARAFSKMSRGRSRPRASACCRLTDCSLIAPKRARLRDDVWLRSSLGVAISSRDAAPAASGCSELIATLLVIRRAGAVLRSPAHHGCSSRTASSPSARRKRPSLRRPRRGSSLTARRSLLRCGLGLAPKYAPATLKWPPALGTTRSDRTLSSRARDRGFGGKITSIR